MIFSQFSIFLRISQHSDMLKISVRQYRQFIKSYFQIFYRSQTSFIFATKYYNGTDLCRIFPVFFTLNNLETLTILHNMTQIHYIILLCYLSLSRHYSISSLKLFKILPLIKNPIKFGHQKGIFSLAFVKMRVYSKIPLKVP